MKGLGISEGIAIGQAFIYQTEEPEIPMQTIDNPTNERVRFEAALAKLTQKLQLKSDKAQSSGDHERAEVFMAHELIANDPELKKGVYEQIDAEGKCAEWALKEVSDCYIQMMEQMEDAYLRQRAGDIRDIRQQLLKLLLGLEDDLAFQDDDKVIMVGKEFNPSAIGLTENQAVKGFLSEIGAPTTHFSILAKIAGIPTVSNVGSAVEKIQPKDWVIIDGTNGDIHINPDAHTIAYYEKKQQEEAAFRENLKALIHEASVTLDGHQVEVIGNIAGVADTEKMLSHGAEGVGLFRSEFIYMDRNSAPTEDEQFEIYKSVLQAMEGKEVVIRTLDVGGDKEIGYLAIEKEDNSFLGYRAIRYCLKEQSIFKTQIRAILRASLYGHAKIMLPMISTVDEVLEAKTLIHQCREELMNKGVEIAEKVEVGIMIEVPSAGIIADLLAEEVDFFSIGTNDLIQYTMAADRMNKEVAHLYHPYHPAFLRMLKMVIDHGHAKGIKIAMCGELASDPGFIPVLIGLGLDEFSMNANALLKARYTIRKTRKREAEKLVEKLLQMKTSDAIKNTIMK